MDIDKLGDKIDNLIEKIKTLKYNFKDDSLAQEAEETKEEIISLLESFLDLASSDAENQNEDDDENSD